MPHRRPGTDGVNRGGGPLGEVMKICSELFCWLRLQVKKRSSDDRAGWKLVRQKRVGSGLPRGDSRCVAPDSWALGCLQRGRTKSEAASLDGACQRNARNAARRASDLHSQSFRLGATYVTLFFCFLSVVPKSAYGPLTLRGSRYHAKIGRPASEWDTRSARCLGSAQRYCSGTSINFSSQCSVINSQRFLSPCSKSAVSGKTVFITLARSFCTSTSASRSR
jgi:hypothetical protein